MARGLLKLCPGMDVLFGSTNAMSDALSFHRQRHSVLAGNVANVDTPDFRPLDLERYPTTSDSRSIATTHSGHLTLSSTDGVSFFFDDANATPSMDGNTVNLERELAKVDANRVRYGVNSRLITKRLAALRYAASDGVG